jgi:hypothetical protein
LAVAVAAVAAAVVAVAAGMTDDLLAVRTAVITVTMVVVVAAAVAVVLLAAVAVASAAMAVVTAVPPVALSRKPVAATGNDLVAVAVAVPKSPDGDCQPPLGRITTSSGSSSFVRNCSPALFGIATAAWRWPWLLRCRRAAPQWWTYGAGLNLFCELVPMVAGAAR